MREPHDRVVRRLAVESPLRADGVSMLAGVLIPRLTRSLGCLSGVTGCKSGCKSAANSAFPSANGENRSPELVIGTDAAIAIRDENRETLAH
jgi:hypothetical protein